MKIVKAAYMETVDFDVLVIGAGAAGLIGALEIASTGRSVALIEAKDRAGGRISTIMADGMPIELGAEFVHGNLAQTRHLLEKAGAKILPVDGSIWQLKEGHLQEQEDFIEDYNDLEKRLKRLKKDKSVAAFLQEDLAGERYENLRFSLHNYVEGYYAADTTKASTEALRDELTKADEQQYRIEGGYCLLINRLEEQCREKGVRFFYSQPVWQLHWTTNAVTAITERGTFAGTKVLITVPVGVLQKESITFFPSLPLLKKSVQKLGFGHVVKVILQFDDPFWKDDSLTSGKDLSDLSFLFSEEEIPTWWTHYPRNEAILTGWLAGPKAANFQFLTKDEIQAKAFASLSRIFNLDVIRLHQKLKGLHYYNWSADPHFCGAYSYEVVGGGEIIHTLQQPVEQTLFFAGEGLHHGPQIGTVEGALLNGREAAHRLIASFSL